MAPTRRARTTLYIHSMVRLGSAMEVQIHCSAVKCPSTSGVVRAARSIRDPNYWYSDRPQGWLAYAATHHDHDHDHDYDYDYDYDHDHD